LHIGVMRPCTLGAGRGRFLQQPAGFCACPVPSLHGSLQPVEDRDMQCSVAFLLSFASRASSYDWACMLCTAPPQRERPFMCGQCERSPVQWKLSIGERHQQHGLVSHFTDKETEAGLWPVFPSFLPLWLMKYDSDYSISVVSKPPCCLMDAKILWFHEAINTCKTNKHQMHLEGKEQ
jgi:hypothetical protein